MDELLTLPGVGRKTANLVLILAFKSLKNICVDTHVHRISNRLGWVRTNTPDETERALYRATAGSLVAVHQPVPRDVGSERVPSGLSALRGVRHRAVLPAGRCDGHVEDMRITFCVVSWRAPVDDRVTQLRRDAGGASDRRRTGHRCRNHQGTFAFETYPQGGAEDRCARCRAGPARILRRSTCPSRHSRAFSRSGAIRSRATPAKEADWGRGSEASSGQPIGAAEISKNAAARRRGPWRSPTPAVRRRPTARCTSRWRARSDLDGYYTVFGQVIAGADVPATMQRGDVITRMYVRE